MKKLLLGAFALTMLATACKKDDSGGSSNSFTVGSTEFTPLSNGFNVIGSTVSLSGTNGSNGGSMVFTFNGSAAPVAGTYKVVSGSPSANQVAVSASTSISGTAASYSSTGDGTINATVTVNSGKISINMPEAPAKQTVGGTATVSLKANVTQP